MAKMLMNLPGCATDMAKRRSERNSERKHELARLRYRVGWSYPWCFHATAVLLECSDHDTPHLVWL